MDILQTQLSHEHSLLRTLTDNLPDGIYVKDIEARKVVANRADLEVLGCKTEAEAVGKTDFDFFPREIAGGFFADDMTVLKTGTPVINREEKAVLPTGETRWLLTTKVPWRTASGKIIGLSTAASIVKNHHGFITVDGELGKGATFKIYLPAQPEMEAENPAAKSAA